MNVYLPYTVRLPSAYQEVEYIQSSGTQIINTGYNITSNMRIVIDFYTPSGTTNNPILGTTYGNWSWTAPMVMNTNEGNLHIATGSQGPYFDGYTTDTKHSLDYNNSRAILDGSTLSISATFNTSYTLTLFYGNSFYGSARIYACQVYTGDTLARNLIPCYRKSDNVIGMYDLVNDQFYTNSGTGTFTKGADVYTNVLQNAYIGEYISLYEGTNGKILHMKTEGEIWMIPTSGTTIKIQDKDAGSSVAGTTSSSRGEWYIFNNLPTAPTGYHIPTKSEWDSVISLWMQITGSTTSTLNDLIMKHLLLPGAGWKNSSGTQNDIGASLYWSSTGIDSSTAYGTAFYPNQSNWNMFNHNKNNKLCMRFFKNT